MINYGLSPTLLDDDIIISIAQYVMKYKKNINKKILKPKTKWV